MMYTECTQRYYTLQNPYTAILQLIWGIIKDVAQSTANTLGKVRKYHTKPNYEYNTDSGAANPLERLHPERGCSVKRYLALTLPANIFTSFADMPIASAYFEHALGLNFSVFATYTQIALLSAHSQKPVYWTELVKGDLVDLEAAEQTERDVRVLLAHGLIEEVENG